MKKLIFYLHCISFPFFSLSLCFSCCFVDENRSDNNERDSSIYLASPGFFFFSVFFSACEHQIKANLFVVNSICTAAPRGGGGKDKEWSSSSATNACPELVASSKLSISSRVLYRSWRLLLIELLARRRSMNVISQSISCLSMKEEEEEKRQAKSNLHDTRAREKRIDSSLVLFRAIRRIF